MDGGTNVLFNILGKSPLNPSLKKKNHVNTLCHKATTIHRFVKYRQAKAQLLSLLFTPLANDSTALSSDSLPVTQRG